MITTGIPEAVARAACHCDELLSRAATPPELDIEFARFARGIAQQSQHQLSQLCDDRGLAVDIADAELLPVGEWFAKVGAAHRHSFYSIGQESRGILISVRIGELVGQFERILGGTGEVDEKCTVLPASANRFA